MSYDRLNITDIDLTYKKCHFLLFNIYLSGNITKKSDKFKAWQSFKHLLFLLVRSQTRKWYKKNFVPPTLVLDIDNTSEN